jgi:hypothetical protein
MAGAVTWAAISSNVTDGLAVLGAGGVASALDGATNVGGGPTTALQPGTKRPLTEDMFRSVLRAGWTEGARFTHAMAVGDLIENIGNYLFSSSARVATLTSDVPQSNRTGVTSGNGARQGGVVAQGAVNMFVGNFGVVTLTPNRQMEAYGANDTADLLFVDPRYPMMATLHDYATKEIAQVGLYDQQVMYCDKTMIPGATRSLGVIADIDLLAPMVAV